MRNGMRDETWNMIDEGWIMRNERLEVMMRHNRWVIRDDILWTMIMMIEDERWEIRDEGWKISDENWNTKDDDFERWDVRHERLEMRHKKW